MSKIKSSLLHKQRKSYRKWSMTGQRTRTEDTIFLDIRRSKSDNPFNVGKSGVKPNYGTMSLVNEPSFIRHIPDHNNLLPRSANRGVKDYSIKIASQGTVNPT